MINEVAPAGEHLEAAVEYAETIASKSPTAIQCGKRAYYEMAGMGDTDAIEYSNEQFAGLCTTADAQAGIEAFLESDPLDVGPETCTETAWLRRDGRDHRKRPSERLYVAIP